MNRNKMDHEIPPGEEVEDLLIATITKYD